MQTTKEYITGGNGTVKDSVWEDANATSKMQNEKWIRDGIKVNTSFYKNMLILITPFVGRTTSTYPRSYSISSFKTPSADTCS